MSESVQPQAYPHLHHGRTTGVAAGSLEAARCADDVLAAGGNVFDAAAALVGALHCTSTPAIGFGGDLVAVGRPARGAEPVCLLALGPAPQAMSVETLRERGHDDVPTTGIDAACVPAATDGVLALLAKGVLDPRESLGSVIDLARSGAVTQDQLARYGPAQRSAFGDDDALAAHHRVDGSLAAGTVRRFAHLADWLEVLATDQPAGRRAFVDELVAASERLDGLLRADDFARPLARWEHPVASPFAGGRVWTTPAPTQGPMLALALAVADRLDLDADTADDATVHLLVEVVKAVYARREIGDPDDGGPRMSLDPAVADAIAAALDPERAGPLPDWPPGTGTTVATVVDDRGGCLAIMGSLSLGFGAGVAAFGGDVVLNNRLCRSATFLDGHPTGLRGGRRPVNTLHTWYAEIGDECVAGGTPGGDDQIGFNLTVLVDHFVRGRPWGKALVAPRFRVVPQMDRAQRARGPGIRLEALGEPLVASLEQRGHRLETHRSLGGNMRLAVSGDGGVAVASDNRQEGSCLVR